MKNIIIAIVLITLSVHAKDEPTVNMKIQASCRADGDFFDTRSYTFYDIFISSDKKVWNEQSDSSHELVNGDLVFVPKKYHEWNKPSLPKGSNTKALGYVWIDEIQNFNALLQDIEHLKLNAKSPYTVKETTNIETWQSEMQPKTRMEFKNGQMVIVQLNPKKIYETRDVTKYRNTYFQINMPVDEWQNAQAQCREQISNDKIQLNIKYISIVLGALLGFYMLFLIAKAIKRLIQNKIAFAKEKFVELKKAKEEKRIRDIAEDESIRSNIKKSMQDAQANEIQDLQELINKAVAKGDSETAQALLKILNRKKSSDEHDEGH
ncbi:MAG: hypothetical protein PHN38_08510 [Sulfurospirillaceae bacterium]|nr:hypothetical protein [Sulfurospirillaceae bacterium]